MSGFLSREEILKPAQLRSVVVVLPELGGKSVRVKALTAGERGRFQSQFLDKDTGEVDLTRAYEMSELLVVATVVDDNGRLMFTPDDVEAIKDIDAAVVARIADVAMQLSRLGKHDNSKDLVKNSETTHASGSGSVSRSTAGGPTGDDSSTS